MFRKLSIHLYLHFDCWRLMTIKILHLRLHFYTYFYKYISLKHHENAHKSKAAAMIGNYFFACFVFSSLCFIRGGHFSRCGEC
jgi:hypothetical protein